MITNRALSIKEIVLVAQVTLLKPSVMQKLDGMNIIIQLKVQNLRNTFKTMLTTVLHGLLFQMLQKMAAPGNLILMKPYLNLYGNLILMKPYLNLYGNLILMKPYLNLYGNLILMKPYLNLYGNLILNQQKDFDILVLFRYSVTKNN